MANQGQSSPIITSQPIIEKASSAGITKSRLRFWPMLLLAILAGMYIAFGGVFATVVATGASGVWPYGVVKTLQGLVFSVGLILVVVGGAELFTGNILMFIPLLQKKITLAGMLRNWLVVYAGNFIGSILIAFLILLGKTYHFSGGEFGKTMLTIALNKSGFSFSQALSLGILCNILVCLAVWLAYTGQNTADKILAIVFPITMFIAAGFEHSVANMYLVPAGLLLKVFDPAFISSLEVSLQNLTWGNFLLNNLLPVTIGNMIGGGLFVGTVYFLVHRVKPVNEDD